MPATKLLNRVVQNGRHLLMSTKVGALETKGKDGKSVYDLDEGATVSHALASLKENKITCLPIKMKTGAHTRHAGSVDLIDLVMLALDFGIMSPDALNDFLKMPCARVANLSLRNPWKPVDPDTPLLEAAELMVHWSVHRLPVLTNEGQLTGLLTATRLVAFVFEKVSTVMGTSDASLFELGVGRKAVVSVTETDTLMDACRLMRDHVVSGVAVVDATTGALTGNVSISDVARTLLTSTDGPGADMDAPLLGKRMETTVKEFLAVSGGRRKPVSVQPDETFADTVELMVQEHVHRVYVVSRSGKPIGVLSQIDVLSIITGSSRRH